MKVRHKHNPPDELWEVLDEGKEYYILQSPKDMHGISRIGHARKSHVEIVKEAPTWRDVTEACAYTDARYLEHDGQRVLGRLADEQYRLSKVQVYKRIAVGSGQTLDVAYTPVSAFLIEKKVSE